MAGRKGKSRDKKPTDWKINLLVCVVALILTFVIADLVYGLFRAYPYRPDDRYGWRISKPGVVHLQVLNDANYSRNITVEYFENGFKRWGDLSGNKTRVFIIGDSFTEVPHVNNGEEWYSYLERAFPNMTFFVYGSTGFGSLQEYLILDEFFDVIKPDILIFQLHYNDFMDNYFNAELREYPMSNRAERPYLENGSIVYRLPLRYAWLRKTSRIMAYVLNNYDEYICGQVMKDKDSFYRSIYGYNFSSDDLSQAKVFQGRLNESFNTTAQIFLLVRQRAGNIPIYLFSADTRSRWVEEFVARVAGITYISGVSDEVFSYHNKGFNTQIINDGHWNVLGHKIAGEYLVKQLNKSLSSYSYK